MLNLKAMNNAELKSYWNACMWTLCRKPYSSMDADSLVETEEYIAAMCMQCEFAERGLSLPKMGQ